ncbi:MAG TPA: MlaD family protein [Stellaceae bacterium]|nr:MlaD family protein [Stellaceae bacterium]
MSEPTPPGTPPSGQQPNGQPPGFTRRARVRPRKFVAWVWIVPVIAAAVVLYLAGHYLLAQGPKITITFEDAEGLEAGHTPIRYKSVQVGTVEGITLSKDLSKVVVEARMQRKIADKLNDQTSFWVVKPRFSAGGVSGLSTLVSGYYIAMEPGSGKPSDSFKGLSEPPVVQADVPGTDYVLDAQQLSGLNQGSPISYRGFEVGQVLGSSLSPDGTKAQIFIFIRKPYDALVRPNSRFWNVSGVQVTAGAAGFKADIASLQSLVSGGIAFDTPGIAREEPVSPRNSHFQLFDDASAVQDQPEGPTLTYRMEFPGSVHGLSVGAPVELLGIRVGRVTELHLEYIVATGQLITPVTVELEPDLVRINGQRRSQDRATIDRSIEKLVQAGLRARLASGSLLTGARYVSMEFIPDPPPGILHQAYGFDEIPTAPAADIDSLTASASRLMSKLAALPLPQIMANIQHITGHLDQTTGTPEFRRAVGDLEKTMANVQRITSDAKTQMPALLASLRQTAQSANATIAAANKMMGADPAAGGQGLPQALSELTSAARSIRTLTDYLDQHPEALLRGRTATR